jgi:hypothetical protein
VPTSSTPLYVTTLEPTTEPSEAAPASALHAADISALPPQVGLPTVHVDQHQREVCRLSPWGDVAHRLNPYPPPYRAVFACSLLLYPPPHRRALRCAFPHGETTGLPRSAGATLCGLGRASPPVARHLRRRSSEPPDLATYLLVQAPPEAAPRRTRLTPFFRIQHLWLVLSNDVYQRFTSVNRTTLSWFPTALMLAVATSPHGCIAILTDEVTLSRELRTPVLPPTHVPVDSSLVTFARAAQEANG